MNGNQVQMWKSHLESEKAARFSILTKSFLVRITDLTSYYDAFGLHEVKDKQGRVGT